MKAVKNKDNFEFVITATYEDNEGNVWKMVNVAASAYGLWQSNLKAFLAAENEADKEMFKLNAASNKSKYESVCDCISLLVNKPTSYVCGYVMALCWEKFGI